MPHLYTHNTVVNFHSSPQMTMSANWKVVLLVSMAFLEIHLSLLTMAAPDCPLDLSGSNFTLAASVCSNKEDRRKCCRYINAFVAVSIARYANATTNLGVIIPQLSGICLDRISDTLELYGVPRNTSLICGFGTKIPVNYTCQGRTTVNQMLQSPKFTDVNQNCKLPLLSESDCKKCLNAGILYLHNLVGAADNLTLSTCRGATFTAIASQVDNKSTIDFAGCFFRVQGLITASDRPPSLLSPEGPPSSSIAESPSQRAISMPFKEKRRPFGLSIIPAIAIAVTVAALMMLVVLVFLILRKSKELEDSGDSDITDETPARAFSQPLKKFQEGHSLMFRKFSYKETKKATNNFSTIVGQGGFGTVYKAQFSGGLMAAVKRMDKVSKQAEDDFCREIELLARLHHRHLVSLRGFCIEKHERFLMYEYMANGSLKDHLHTPGQTPLNWKTRVRIAIDVANALEYFHFYCNPPLCHRDIKTSNILLDENFGAKVADFGLTHASEDGSICFQPVNTEIRGTPGYMDPEYMVTQELTEKSDVYSYGVVLLELVTARRAIQENRNLVEWSQELMTTESRLTELVDPTIGDSFDLDQLQTIVNVIKWCTQREGIERPSIKQVLRVLYECSDPMHEKFIEAVEEEEYGGTDGRRRRSKGKTNSWNGTSLASSASTSRSYCSRSFLLELGSPQSPSNNPSL